MRVLNYLWLLPLKILKSQISKGKKPRRLPLHTFGVSALDIARFGCKKAQSLDKPLGSIAKKVVTIFNTFFPFVYIVILQWLAFLSFIDEFILIAENLFENAFPRSKFVFDKIDDLVFHAEVTPQRLDDLWKKIPFVRREPTVTNEKEITIDVNCKDNAKGRKLEQEIKVSIVDHSRSNDQEKEEEKEGRNFIEPSIAKLSEVIHKSVKRLHTIDKKRKNEGCFCEDSPTCASFKSAVSSPRVDGSDSDDKSETLKCTYKEVLKKG